MFDLLIASILVACGSLLVWWLRRPPVRPKAAPSVVQPDNDGVETRLVAEMRRQGVVPYGVGTGPVHLLPILAWQLYAAEARAVYNRSRELDIGLMRCVDNGTMAVLAEASPLHEVLRDVRRELMMRLMLGRTMEGAAIRELSEKLEMVSKAVYAASKAGDRES